MLTFGSLCSGIGGIDLGLECAGMRCRWQVEIDEWRRSILAHHWPDVRRHDDIRTFALEPDPSLQVDLVCAGVPCQPVSVAGKRRGKDDPRWLWDETFRVVRVLRPRYVLLENPGGIFAEFSSVLSGLAEIGFSCEWQVLSAAQFGAPHLRERVWIVAYPDADGCTPEWKTSARSARSSRDESRARPIAYPDEPRLALGQGIRGDARQELAPAQRGGMAQVFAGEPRRPMPDPSGSRWWPTQPPVRARDDGLPRGLARRQLEAAGDSVCVPVVTWIGQQIVRHASASQESA